MSVSSATTLRTRLAAALATLTAAGAAALALAPAPASAATTTNWVTTGWNIQQLDRLAPATTTHFFNTPTSYATGPNAAASPLTNGFTTSTVLVYDSYAQFAADIASHTIAPTYHWVMYDPEYWPATPLNEQQNPAQYMQQFGQLAHANGLNVIEAPGRDLGLVPGAACPQAPGQNLNQWYLACDIPAAAAADADLVVIQDQVNTTTPGTYAALYSAAQAQAHTANPQATIDAEISTSYGTATQMAAAAQAAGPQGIYLSATTPTLTKARGFLHLMQLAGY